MTDLWKYEGVAPSSVLEDEKRKKVLLNKKELYIYTSEGDILLMEVFSENGNVSLILAGKTRIDLTLDSAFDLADALIQVTSEASSDGEQI